MNGSGSRQLSGAWHAVCHHASGHDRLDSAGGARGGQRITVSSESIHWCTSSANRGRKSVALTFRDDVEHRPERRVGDVDRHRGFAFGGAHELGEEPAWRDG